VSHPEPAPSPTPNQPGVCHHRACTNPTNKQGWNGPPRLYCSNRCRQAEYRERRTEQGPGHAPPPDGDAATAPLQRALACIVEEYRLLPQNQLQSDYADELAKLHRHVEIVSTNRPTSISQA